MGRVLAEVKVENLRDLWAAEEGRLSVDQVRSLAIDNALVDTGATTLALPTRYIRQLGLTKSYDKKSISTQGLNTVSVYEAVRLTIQDRFLTVDVMEVPDDVPVLIGQIPLVMLDLVIDPRQQKLIGNPAHKGEHILELL